MATTLAAPELEPTEQDPAAARREPRRRRPMRPRSLGRMLIAPGVALLLLLVLFPVAVEVYISLTQWSPTVGDPWYEAYKSWSWLSNYSEGLTSASFLTTLLRTALITIGAVAVEFALGFTLALLFVERFPLKRLATVLLLIPMMIVPAVSGFVFFLLFGKEGPVNALLSMVVPGEVSIGWLSDPGVAPFSVALVDIWQWTPLMFLILLSGMNAVPTDQLNAARILGAGWRQRLRYIVLPIMKPIIIIALIIRAMEAFKLFDSAWLLTQGGPGEASSTISVLLYREAFINARWSYVAALAIIVMALVSVAAAAAIRPLEAHQEAT